MEIEDLNRQRVSLIEKYDYYTYHEFSLKPTLLSHYIILLKEEKEYDKIDQIFLCYLHQFNQFYQREEALYKQQQLTLQGQLNDYAPSVNYITNYIPPLKLTPLVQSKKKLKKLLHFLISYQHTLNIRKYLENEKIREFDQLFFDSLILYAASKNDSTRDAQLNQERPITETIAEELVLNLIQILQTQKRILSKENILESLYAICYFYFVQEQFEKCNIYVKQIDTFLVQEDGKDGLKEVGKEGINEENTPNHESSSFFRKDYYEGIQKICYCIQEEQDKKPSVQQQNSLGINNQQILKNEDIKDFDEEININEQSVMENEDDTYKRPIGFGSLQKIRRKRSYQEFNEKEDDQADQEMNNQGEFDLQERRDSFFEEGDLIKNSRKNSVSKMMSQDMDEEESDSYHAKGRSDSVDQYDLIDQNFYTSFTGLSENQQVKIADSLLQQNLNHQNNVDLENQKEFHILLCKEDSTDTNLSLNLITIQIQTDGIQQNTIETYTQQCEDIIKQQGIPIPSSIFAFFMTLSKFPKFEECIQSVIYSIEGIIKNFCTQNQLNYNVIYENLSLPEGYERNERREGILGLRNYQEIYSVYTLILLKSIFYLRWVIVNKKGQKDSSSIYDQPKNEDILKNVFMLWNILYQFNLKKKSQIAQFIQITNNYTCLQIIKAVIFSYWTRYLLEKVHQNLKKQISHPNQALPPRYTFNLTQIGQLLAQDDIYLQTEQDFFNYTSTYSLKFEDFDEYIIINSLAPQFSVKNFEEESFEFLLSQIFKQEKKMLKQYNSEQSGSSSNNKGVDMEEQNIENKQLFLGKKEQNQYKSYKKYAIEKIRYYYLSGNYAKSLRLLINLMNQNFLQKYKNQEIFTKESINSMLATSLYHQKCYVECLICLQFSDKVNYSHIQKVLEKISYFNYSYVPLLLNITLIKQLLVKFIKDSVLSKKLAERMESPECYQNYSDGKYHKIKTLLKIKFLKILKDKQFEIQQMKVVSSSVKSVSLSSYQSAKQL